MAQKKFRKTDVLMATGPFVGRSTPPAPMNGDVSSPDMHSIIAGMQGLCHGTAHGAPDLLDVEFERGDGSFVRVEAPMGLVQHA